VNAGTVETRRFAFRDPFGLESGTSLPSLALAYRTWGRLAPAADNAVVVCHALTGSADVDAWWPALLGPGRALDPERDFVVCVNVPGSCYGSTGPVTAAPDGTPWGARFPAFTVRDTVNAQRALLDHLGVRAVRLVLGGSLGGMQALEWALLDRRVRSAAVIAAPARHEAWAIAWSDAQRRALVADPAWDSDRSAVRAGLAAARAIAMISYRAPQSFAARFGRGVGEREPFAVRDWLAHHGRALLERFDAASYAVLLDTMDAHDVGAGRGGVEAALGAVHVPVLVLGIDSDHLYPPREIEALASALPRGELAWLRSPHGHDAFLIEARDVEREVRAFRARHRPAAVPAARAGAALGDPR
jgi:homoserine O-acetyltransferase